jgi:hypothetical protein
MIVFLREVNTLIDYNSIVLSGLLYSKEYYPVIVGENVYLLNLSPKKIQQMGLA